jgi:hypothetical protein
MLRILVGSSSLYLNVDPFLLLEGLQLLHQAFLSHGDKTEGADAVRLLDVDRLLGVLYTEEGREAKHLRGG